MSDTTDRNRLVEDLLGVLCNSANFPHSAVGMLGQDMRPLAGKVADRILETGWRPPARVVTTVDELEALVEGTVVIVAGESYVRTFYFWIEGGYMSPWARSSEEMLRDVGDVFTVIYEPEEGE